MAFSPQSGFANDRAPGAGVTAVLGPTNTGKTHLAIERLLAHSSGIIGLPLRLLAREVYNKIADRAGSDAVALITGEEKIKPPRPRFWVSTVEAMPRDLDVSFLAVDEIQIAAAPIENAIGKDVAAFEVGRDLDLVDGEKRHVEIARHRFHRGDPEARPWRLDLFFPGDERDRIRTGAIGYLVVDLARKQPQRQADHSGGMRQHPLNRQMRLAGVGRPEHGRDPRTGSPSVCKRGRR